MTRAQLILATYNREVSRFATALQVYLRAVRLGNLRTANTLAPIVRRRAAAILATIAECSPEGGE